MRGRAKPEVGTERDGRLDRLLEPWRARYRLTTSELLVVKYASRGLSNKEIGSALGTTVATVRTHLLSVGRKLGVNSRGELAYRVFREVEEALQRETETERVARAAAERSRDLLESAFANAPVGIGILDTSLRYVHVNAALAELNGKPLEEHHGRTVREIMPSLAPRLEPLLTRVLETGEPLLNGVLATDHDGTTGRWVFSYFPVRGPKKEILGVGAVIYQTERLPLPAPAGLESDAGFREVVDAVPGLAFTFRPDGVPEHVNRRVVELTGIDAATWRERWAETFHPDDVSALQARWLAALGDGRPYEATQRLRRRDGTYRWVVTRCLPVHDAAGRIVRWFGTSTDVDDLIAPDGNGNGHAPRRSRKVTRR
jgi:PAS domain S-box-containing protein